MSRPQGLHPSLFHFERTSRMMLPKGSSNISPQLLTLLNSFEDKLTYSLKKLMTSAKDNILSLSWMKLAMESLCETHIDIKTLIVDLELPVTNWDDEYWTDVYLNTSVKLLDLCNALSSEVSRLGQGNLMLQCALQNVDLSSEKMLSVHHSLLRWRRQIDTKNPKLESCGAILESLIASLNLPRIKNSDKEKVLMRAMYGVKVKTLFISGVFTAAFSASSKKLVELHVPEALAWSDSYTKLQMLVNEEIRNQLTNTGATTTTTIVKELAAVDAAVSNLLRVYQVDEMSVDSEALESAVSNLSKAAEQFSHKLQLLSTELDSFFRIVIAGRDTLLCSLRSGNTMPTSPKKKHWATVK